jgi:phytoene dehydrogenase-like protein
MAAHSMLSLDSFLSASFGLVLGALGHAVGWPVARGGSQKIADALATHLRGLGGRVITEKRIGSIEALSSVRPALFDVTPRQLLDIAGSLLPSRFQSQLRQYRYGPGVFKLEYALDAPVPWTARECRRAGTVHLGGTLEEIAASENSVVRCCIPERPFVLVAQPSLFDPTRAPEGKHTLWAYCHVPNGAAFDMTGRIEAQIERFAPGFQDRILARRTTKPIDLEGHNANCIGGDISGGILDIHQFITRPTHRLNPYSTPVRGLYLCSASTPPGGGVHGMCGYNAAMSVLHECRPRRC